MGLMAKWYNYQAWDESKESVKEKCEALSSRTPSPSL